MNKSGDNYADSMLNTYWSDLPKDLKPIISLSYDSGKLDGKIQMYKKTKEYIEILKIESFEGWSQEAIDGYLTACESIIVFLGKGI